MLDFLFSIARTSVLMSLGIIFLFLLNIFFSKRLSAKWRYYVWIIVILGLLIPFKPSLDLPLPQVNVPVYSIQQTEEQQSNQIPDNTESKSEKRPTTNDKAIAEDSVSQENITEDNFQKIDTHINIINVLFLIWFIGATVIIGINLFRHKTFLKTAKRWSVPVNEKNILELKKNLESELGIKHGKISMNICNLVPSPMFAGIIKPIILLPNCEYNESDLKYILKHELIHYKRKDIIVKILLLVATSIHWFNPFVYVMNKEVDNACEISCDDLVVQNENFTQKRIYSEAIINMAQSRIIKKYALSTYFYGGKKTMKKRIKSIFEISKKSKLITVLSITVIIATTILSSTFFYALTEEPSNIVKEAITEITNTTTSTKIPDKTPIDESNLKAANATEKTNPFENSSSPEKTIVQPSASKSVTTGSNSQPKQTEKQTPQKTEKPTATKEILNKGKLSMVNKDIEIFINESRGICAEVIGAPKDAVINWKSSNLNIAYISPYSITDYTNDSGKRFISCSIDAKGIGTATITAVLSNGEKAECRVTIERDAPCKVTLNTHSVNLRVGDSIDLLADIFCDPQFGGVHDTDYWLQWSCDNLDVADFVLSGNYDESWDPFMPLTCAYSGKVTAKNKGTVIVTVNLVRHGATEKKDTCIITIE